MANRRGAGGDAAGDGNQEDGNEDVAIVLDGEEENGGGEEDEVENPLAHLPESVRARVERLVELDSRREALMEQYVVERAALEKKFEGQFDPIYAERAQIVRGDGEDEAPAESSDPVQEPPVKGIPHFWITAMSHHDEVGEWITEQDVDCLESLENITCVDKEDGKGFQLHFHFAPNDYFTNSVLTKSYDVPNLLLSDEPMLKGVKGTSIEWKPDRSLTYRMVKKKQRGKGKHAGQVRTVQKKEELDSFFKWFEPPEMPPMESMDEEGAEELEEFFEEDFDLAMAFRTQIIPRAVLWFTGEALEEGEEEDGGDDEDPDGIVEEDEDDN